MSKVTLLYVITSQVDVQRREFCGLNSEVHV
jgi:hypothetical protein